MGEGFDGLHTDHPGIILTSSPGYNDQYLAQIGLDAGQCLQLRRDFGETMIEARSVVSLTLRKISDAGQKAFQVTR